MKSPQSEGERASAPREVRAPASPSAKSQAEWWSVPPLNRLSAFHRRVLFSSPSSASFSSSTSSSFFGSSGVRMYSRCV
ncbi:hypothetical protein EYF80_019580 [Liparis tanakae]|uniref:Uncharacterized protein n=1 Tax=Liparis tanakae TaxID=230148 RepID=A0A4Z2HWK6_9TELE|nr:hypothetical protein EYF80_019580 [Liparis tanakae]